MGTENPNYKSIYHDHLLRGLIDISAHEQVGCPVQLRPTP